MQMWLKVFTEKLNTLRHYMWRFIADLSAVINTAWAEKKIKTEPHSAKSRSIIDMIETRTTSLGQNLLVEIKKRVFWVFWELFLTVVVLTSTFENKNNLRTIEARPKFTGSYRKKSVYCSLSVWWCFFSSCGKRERPVGQILLESVW